MRFLELYFAQFLALAAIFLHLQRFQAALLFLPTSVCAVRRFYKIQE